jgi:O-antigen/teichoic acid export membrane protein
MAAVLATVEEPPSGHVSWIFASTATFFVAGGVFYLYLARVLPTGELGAVVVLGALASLVSIAAALGLGGGFQHFLAFYQSRSEHANLRALLRSAFVVAILLSLLAAGVVVALAGPLSSFFFHTDSFRSTIEFLGLYAGLATAATLLQSVLIGLQRFVTFSIVYIFASVSTYGTPVILLHFWPGAETVVFGWALGAGLGVIVSAGAVLRCSRQAVSSRSDVRLSSAGSRLYRDVLLYSLPLLAATLVGTAASYVDRLVLASLANLSSVGVYNYAILVTTGSLFVVAPFATVLVPRISAAFGRNEPRAIRAVGRTSITLIVLIYVPFALGLAAVGPALLRILVGPAFVGASLPLAVLLGITALSIPYAILISIASGIRKTKYLLYSSALALASNVALSVVLVPRFGLIGAAIGNSSMYAVVLVVLFLQLRPTGLVLVDLRSISRVWVSSLLMCGSVAIPLFLLGYSTIVVLPFVAVGFVVLLVFLRLTHAIPSDAMDALIRFLPRWAAPVRPVICWTAGCDRCQHEEDWTRWAGSALARHD